jgi:CBS domain containing-hemolysin-like protein
VTIEDLLEAIVGNIEDEHDSEGGDAPVAEADGTFVVPGSFDVSRLRELLEERTEPAGNQGEECIEEPDSDAAETEPVLTQLLSQYEATTIGGLVSEMAGHIPLPGEVVGDGPLRLEVIASTDRLVERVRVGLTGVPVKSEAE